MIPPPFPHKHYLRFVRHKAGGYGVADREAIEALAAAMVAAFRRKRAENELRASEERFRSFLENLTDTAYITDTEGNVIYVNRRSEELTGLPRTEIVGRPFLPLFAEESRPEFMNAYQRTLAGETTEPTRVNTMLD